MRPLGGNLEGLPNSRGIVGVDPHDEWGIWDIHVERGHHLVVNGPPRAPRKDHGAGHDLLAHIDERYTRGVRDIRIADIRHEQQAAAMVECEPARPNAAREPCPSWFLSRP